MAPKIIDKLGTVSLSLDVLTKANIGLWSFELDEGSEPRMYVDDTMLGLIGLKHQVSPEETYHAWYDHIDSDSYDLVTDAVAKMSSGEHAEVQYPWHHPDGHTMIVRCGGILNPSYKKGIRIEGTHQNVTEVLHYEEEEIDRLRLSKVQLQHEQLRSDVLNYMIDNDDDPIELLKLFADKLRVLINCDQVIYRDLVETRIMVNSPAIEKTWSVPFEYCRQCQHLDAHHPMYSGGYTEMENCQEGWQGIPVYHKCPIKSSLTRLTYCDGKVAGYLAIHYVQDYHKFTDLERKTIEEFTRILSISLSRYEARKENKELKLRKQLDESQRLIDSFIDNFDVVFRVNLDDLSYSPIKTTNDMPHDVVHGDNYLKAKDAFVASIVYKQERETVAREMDIDTIRRNLMEASKYNFEFRNKIDGVLSWNEMEVSAISGNEILIGYAQKDEEILFRRLHDKMNNEYFALYAIDLDQEVLRVAKPADNYDLGKANVDIPYEQAMRSFADTQEGEAREFFLKLSDLNFVKKQLQKEDKYTFSYKSQNLDGKWVTVTSYVIDRHPDGKPAIFTLGFSIMDTMGADRQEIQTNIQRNLEIIQALAADYSSVYYIDVDHESVTPYSMNKETAQKMGDIFKENKSYPEAFSVYVDKFVYEPDKEMVLREGSRENVLEKLSKNDSFVIIFRGFNEGEVSFCEMKFVVAHKEGKDIKSVALGFAFKDNEIMAQYINEKLVAEYISAFMVDLDKNKYRIYRHPDTTSVMERPDRVWSLAMADFAKECDPEYFQLVKNIGSPEFLKKELADVDRREYHYRFQSASQPWRRSVVQVIDRVDGVPSTVVATFMSIDDFESKIKDQEKQLAAQQDQLQEALSMAQSANRAKTTFLNNMSHDIRTPMNAIIGYTGLAASHIDNKELVQDYLGKISQSSDHLLSLINDVLDMSRIESGKMHLDEKVENLSDIIHTLRDIVQANVHSKQLDFFIDAVDVYDENVVCDKLRLNQVLLNILSNAIKYTPAGGTVSMRVSEKTIKENGYATYQFVIKDNGIGMSQSFLETIFDPFTRVKSSTVSGIQGTGLGMAISKNIIDMMGGKIDIKSKLDEGTEVTITFDFKLMNAAHLNVDIPELKGVRGLIVDDDAHTCMSIAKMLKEIGMRSLWCTSGKEAILRAEDAFRNSDSYKVYIIDWLMPDLNGLETARRIRKVVGDESPIIILTAYDWSDIEEEAREAGVTAFISKPMFASDLRRVLMSCFGIEEVSDDSAAAENYDFKGRKILVVEDNDLNREIATAILEEYNCKVFQASDGDIAVDMIQNASAGDYDLILMDIQMPSMDGHEATRQIRALGTEISKIPIIAMTANAFAEDRMAALDAGMNEHIAKPIDIDKLKQVLARFLL